MQLRDSRELISGLLIGLAGASVSLFAASSYDLGTLQRMGPGMFPFGLGLVLAILGIVVAVPAFLRAGPPIVVRKRASVAVLASVAAFAFGLIPAIFGVTTVASTAEKGFRPVTVALLCLALSVIAFVVFRLMLNLPITLFRFPL
jgi:hypothetical protein